MRGKIPILIKIFFYLQVNIDTLSYLGRTNLHSQCELTFCVHYTNFTHKSQGIVFCI